jgi:predicted RNase H-like HicB family nuclease
MARKKFSKTELVRITAGLEAYPAVLLPAPEGGFDVIFPNLPGVKAYGIRRESALKAGREILSAEVLKWILDALRPPRPSDPERLIPDEDEPAGAELVMIEVDHRFLARRLGIQKRERSSALKSLGVYGR